MANHFLVGFFKLDYHKKAINQCFCMLGFGHSGPGLIPGVFFRLVKESLNMIQNFNISKKSVFQALSDTKQLETLFVINMYINVAFTPACCMLMVSVLTLSVMAGSPVAVTSRFITPVM